MASAQDRSPETVKPPFDFSPDKVLSAPLGVASPLWLAFAGAASAGVAYWWMTRWMRPDHLEAAAVIEPVMIEPQAAPEPLLEAAPVHAEPEPIIEAAPTLPEPEPVIESAPVLTAPEPVLNVAPLVAEPVIETPTAIEAAVEPFTPADPDPAPVLKTSAPVTEPAVAKQKAAPAPKRPTKAAAASASKIVAPSTAPKAPATTEPPAPTPVTAPPARARAKAAYRKTGARKSRTTRRRD